MARDVIRDQDGNTLKMDVTTGAIATQTDIHRMSHLGLAFEVSRIFSAVAAAGTVDIVFEVPSGYEMSCAPEVSSDQPVTVEIKKLATLTPNVLNTLTALNLKTASTNVSNSTFSHTPTAMGAETQALGPRFFPAGGSGVARSVIEDLAEIHLSPGFYTYRATNSGSVASTINLAMLFYEEDFHA